MTRRHYTKKVNVGRGNLTVKGIFINLDGGRAIVPISYAGFKVT